MTAIVNVRTNIDAFSKSIDRIAYQQLPFATAQALNELAKEVIKAEQANEAKVLDRPRPFTTNAVNFIRAKKDKPTATIFMRDTTAKYLEPYEFGGVNKLNGRALLKPVESVKDLDKFGNLPRNYLKKLVAQKDVFVGSITFKKSGKTISGVWRRPENGDRSHLKHDRLGRLVKGQKMTGTKGALRSVGGVTTGLELLIRFTDAHPVRHKLGWFNLAGATVSRNFNAAMGKALARAVATARSKP